jgi:hypothetical protein
MVAVGVLRNNVWSLRFTEQVHILFSSLDSIQWDLLESEYKAFDATQTFHIGHLVLKKGASWKVTFPGLHLHSNKWIVAEKGLPQEVAFESKEVRDLLEFAIHMKRYGQLTDE